MKTQSKSSPTKSKASAHKVTKAPTRTSTRLAAKSMALKMEKNTRQEKQGSKKTIKAKSPKSPTRNSKRNLEKVINEMKEEEEINNREFELNESFRDNPRTSRNSQSTYNFSKSQLDAYKCQMHFEDINIDLYPSAIRAIENSDNDLAIRALHNVECLHNYKF